MQKMPDGCIVLIGALSMQPCMHLMRSGLGPTSPELSLSCPCNFGQDEQRHRHHHPAHVHKTAHNLPAAPNCHNYSLIEYQQAMFPVALLDKQHQRMALSPAQCVRSTLHQALCPVSCSLPCIVRNMCHVLVSHENLVRACCVCSGVPAAGRSWSAAAAHVPATQCGRRALPLVAPAAQPAASPAGALAHF